MKMDLKLKSVLLMGALAIATPARAGIPIVYDDFGSGTNGADLTGRTPVTSLPGSKWVNPVNQASLKTTTTSGYGNPLPGAWGPGGNCASAISIASVGTYVKPKAFTISADISPMGNANSDDYRGFGLGFYSTIGTGLNYANNCFTGLALELDGALSLVRCPAKTGFPGDGASIATIAFAGGTFNPAALYRLSYDVNTTTGRISNISLAGSSADYSAFATATFFTDAATPYAGAWASNAVGAGCGKMDNFSIIDVSYSPALSTASVSSGIAAGGLVATLSGINSAGNPEASTFAFAAGAGDSDNAKFVINGDRLEAGTYDFMQAAVGTQYQIRVQGTSTASSSMGEKAFVLTLIEDDDADTLPDAWELEFAEDLTTLDGTGNHDFDGDGLTDLQEYNLRASYPGLSPLLADSDDDGLTDYQELYPVAPRPVTHPLVADTDKDGLLDAVESNTGIFGNAADTGTNPLKADTDGDGARDGFEVEGSSVPTDFASRPTLPASFAVVRLTDDAGSGISTNRLYTHAVSGGAAATINGVTFGALTAATTPANFTWTGAPKSSMVGNGTWNSASGGVTGAGLASLLGSFTYGSGNPGDVQTYTLGGLTVGTRYEFRMYIRQWDTGTLRPIDLVFTHGDTLEQPYGGLLEDRPGIILNNSNDNSAYYLSYTYVAEATSLVIDAKIHPSSPAGSGSLHLYGLSNESPAQLVISLLPEPFISGISTGEPVGTLQSETLTMEAEPTSYVFATGNGDDDNSKFIIAGDQILAGTYNFKQDPEDTLYFIRVKGTGSESGFTQEKTFILHPIKDDDADTLPDPWELEIAGNLTDLNGTAGGPGPGAGSGDFDGDGLTDMEEYNFRTTYPGLSPLLADSDDDGLTDYQELYPEGLRPATNPILADTDKDGLSDGVETNTGTFVGAGDTGTNPKVADTDLDGARDGFEIERGSVPTDIASRPALPAGFAVVRLTDDASSAISTAKTYTHAVSGGAAATVNGVAFDTLTPATVPANFTWTNTAKQSLVNNGDWVPASGGVTGPGLLSLLGSFSYGSANPGDSQSYTLSGLTLGTQYQVRLYIRQYGTGTPRPIDLVFTNGASVEQPYGGLLEDRPGIVLDNGNDNSAYFLSHTYVAETTSLVIDAKVHPSSPGGSGGFHLYGLTNEVASTSDYDAWAAGFGSALSDPSPAADPDRDGLSNQQEYAFGLNPTKGSSVNPISVPLSGSQFAYTRRAGSGLSYKVLYSTNLTDWAEDQNAVQTAAAAVAGVETVTVTLVNAAAVDGRLFVRVRAGN